MKADVLITSSQIAPFTSAGEPMVATIHAFKKGKAEIYHRTEGIIFTVNGQTYGYLTADFFDGRKSACLILLTQFSSLLTAQKSADVVVSCCS